MSSTRLLVKVVSHRAGLAGKTMLKPGKGSITLELDLNQHDCTFNYVVRFCFDSERAREQKRERLARERPPGEM